jgi:SAM-dependent methyltransferase
MSTVASIESLPNKLHLGAGGRRVPGYLNTDLLDLPGVDKAGVNVSELRDFGSGTQDAIYASHVLEHVPRPRTFSTLIEWNRVLKPGGLLRIAVPCWEATVKRFNQEGDYENLLNWIYGGAENPHNVHFRQFTFAGLKTLLVEAGFKRVSRYDWRETELKDLDDFSKAYWPHMDSENGILMSLNVQCVKHLYPPDYR